MIPYNQDPVDILNYKNKSIHCFKISDGLLSNIDEKTVESFGNEWEKFSRFSDQEINNVGDEYFDIVDSTIINKNTVVLDLGCGSGRWTKYIANKVSFVEAIDPSKAVISATVLLNDCSNVRVSKASVDNIPFNDNSFDFSMSLGVLHHIPDTRKALLKLVEKTKKGGYILLYLYYSLDNRGNTYKLLFKISTYPRLVISKMPKAPKKIICDLIAVLVYLPLIIVAKCVKMFFTKKLYHKRIPLAYYIDKSFNVIRNDALDRFGTPLEQRFSKDEIEKMMMSCGLTDIKFSENEPYWHVLGKKVE